MFFLFFDLFTDNAVGRLEVSREVKSVLQTFRANKFSKLLAFANALLSPLASIWPLIFRESAWKALRETVKRLAVGRSVRVADRLGQIDCLSSDYEPIVIVTFSRGQHLRL